MAKYNLGRFDPNIQTPRTTRCRRQRRRRERNADSDSSIEDQRWRDNYAVVANILNTMEDSSENEGLLDSNLSSPTDNSETESLTSDENDELAIDNIANYDEERNSSPDAVIPAGNDRMSSRSRSYESTDEEADDRREVLLNRFLDELEDENASDDDFDEVRVLLEDPAAVNALQNALQEMLRGDNADEIINGRVNVTTAEIFLAVLKFSLIHNLSQSAIADLFRMLNLFFSISILPQSQYLINKMFNFEDDIDYYALCPNCKNYIGQFRREDNYRVRCDPCNLQVNVKDPTYREFFVIINPQNEIAHYIEQNWDHYQSVVQARARNQDNKNEFHSGLLYKQLRNSLPDYQKDKFITATFNSDGSPVFQSSIFSIWPIQLIINELPFELRSSKPIVCGLWFGTNKPSMNIFFEPFVTQMNVFSNEGITCEIRDVLHTVYVYAICSCDDSVARAPMQGLTQFNGYYRCNWCLHPGYYIAIGRGGCVKYILLDEPINERNEADTLRQAQEAAESGESVFGVLKVSVLTRLKHFNIIYGFVPDPMHFIDLGIGKQFMKYWFDARNMPYSLTNEEINAIDNFLKKLKVPSKLMRNSRSIRDRNHWKAKEYQNWILYYSTVALLMIPRMKCYAVHWSYLVKAYYILLQSNISREQIFEAHRLLTSFVALTEFYYSRNAMTFNAHQLLHVAQSVINWGSLYYHSGYSFENGNGQIVKQVHAAKGVIYQICRTIGMKKSDLILTKFMLESDPESKIVDYARYLETKESTKVLKTNVGRYFGAFSRPTRRWIRQLNLSDSSIVYKKLVKMQCTYLSCNVVRLRSNNSYAKTIDGNFIQIVSFIIDRLNRQEYTVCKFVDVIDIVDNNNHFDEFQIK